MRLRHFYKQALPAVMLCMALAAQSTWAQTTVAGTTPGQFSVNESGAATYSIPIQVPPGVAGMQPQLSLEYNSQGGNGLLGMGWSLNGLSSITRCPRTMAQDGVRGGVNYDMNDRFCLDGQRLVLVSGTYGAANSEYRTERESFSKITAYGTAGNGPAYFTMQTKAGLTMELGNTADSRIEAQGKPTVRVWALNRIQDTRTNYLTVSYTEDSVNGDYYPSRVDYAGNVSAGQAPANSVQFTTETRPDITRSHTLGSVVSSTVRITNAKTYAGTTFVKDYRIAYELGIATKRSRLKTLRACNDADHCTLPINAAWTEVGTLLSAGAGGELTSGSFGPATDYVKTVADFNGDGKSDLAAIYTGSSGFYAYTALGRGDGTFEPVIGGQLMAGGFGPPTDYVKSVADFNGDGKSDLVAIYTGVSGFYAYVALGRGDGTFEPVIGGQLMAGSFGPTADYAKAIADFNGDGKSDLVAIHTGSSGFYAYVALGRGDGTFEPVIGGQLMAGGFGPPTDYVKSTADFNGDGKSDLVAIYTGVSGFYAYVALGRGDGTFEPVIGGQLMAGSFGPTADYAKAIADFNGDGKSDLAAVYTGVSGFYSYVALGRGDGTFEPVRGGELMAGSFGPPENYVKSSADFNGDGKSDLVAIHTGASGFYAYTALGRGDGTFESVTGGLLVAGSFGPATDYVKPAIDLNGDGKSDLVAIYTGTSGFYAYSVMNSGGVSDLLSTFTFEHGTTTSIIHKPLTDNTIYTKDSTPNASVYPKVDLQYPQYVVSTVSTSNGVGGVNTVQYNYGGLKAEQGTGRGLLGFRWMKSRSVANNIESYTEFNQNWPFTGTVAKNETRLPGSGNAGLLKRTTNTYSQSPGSAGASVFVYPSQSVEESWDLSGTAYPGSTTSYVYGQSPQYGDPTQITVSNSEGASKTTVNEYWPADSSNWILGRLKKASVTSVKP